MQLWIGSPPVWSRDKAPEGLGDEVSQKLKGCEVGRGCPSPLGSLGEVWGSQIFFNFYLKTVSFGAFWVTLYVIYLLIYGILKENFTTSLLLY